ncbi:MAG: hypothetical protein VR69_13110 [Peptococcaceae bacterium BRH_c4b]|nr:MAG: hypothetical protein VR69_13110 [Peptococcaceae bacterium BRH_c4b]
MTSNQDKGNIKVVISKDKLAASISAKGENNILDKETINNELAKAGVVFGVLADEIESFIVSPSKEPVVIARGLPPTPGVDETVELLFSSAIAHENLDDRDTVDFRETSTLVSVDEGTLLAKKHPSSDGSDGLGVTGEILPPPKPRTIQLQAGKGAVLSDSGGEVYSTISGRPWVKVAGTNRTVGCDSVYLQDGDVDIKTGNLRFKGDIRITGNVQEAMEVQATGNIEVMGFVTRATVISGAKLVIRGNVVGSKLRSGIIFPGARKINFMLMDIYTELMNLAKAFEQLKKVQNIDFNKMDFGRVLLGMMDSRFKNLRPLLKNMHNFAETQGEDMPEEIVTAVDSLKCLSGLSNATIENFSKAVKSVGLALDFLSQNKEQSDSHIFIRSAMTSIIQSAGNVTITGQGCLNTTINAGGNVIVKGSFKGGEILCEGHAEIQELGSGLGIPPVIRVGENSSIKVEKAFPGAVVQVGKNRITLTREMGSFKAKLNRDEQLELF